MIGHAYVTPFDSVQHFAFVLGAIGDGRDVPTRLHRADIISDVMCGAPTIKKTLARFAREGRGVLVYLRDGAAGVPANIVGRQEDEEERAEETRKRQWLRRGSRRADFERPRRLLDPPALLVRATARFRRTLGFRNRDYRGGAGGVSGFLSRQTRTAKPRMKSEAAPAMR